MFHRKEKSEKMNSIDVESIIFDLDGTLWDSADNVSASWNIAVKNADIPCLDSVEITGGELRRAMGKPMDELARHFFPMLPEDRQMKLLDKCMQTENEYVAEHGGKLYENEEAVLKVLSEKHRLFIVSNCQKGYIEAFLQASGFGKFFSGFLCWGDTGVQKSITIRLLMEKHGCTSAAYVGDTDGDCKASFKAAIPFVHAAYGFGSISDESHVAASAENFEQLTKIFA